MNGVIASPFACMREILDTVDADIHLVDFHGEATSEKIAFAYAFAGEVAAVVGTHTHVQTADERVIEGTAAISDLGMCGAYRSVLGRDVEEILARFVHGKKRAIRLQKEQAFSVGQSLPLMKKAIRQRRSNASRFGHRAI